jgi:hypothetical protein
MLMIAYGATIRPKAPYPNKAIQSPSILQRATISQRVWKRVIGIFGMLKVFAKWISEDLLAEQVSMEVLSESSICRRTSA